MVKSFQCKIPFDLKKSHTILLESGDEMNNWQLIASDRDTGLIEWEQKSLFGIVTAKIRAYLREPRPCDTLVTIYINCPFEIIDPLKMGERVFDRLQSRLEAKLDKPE